MTGGDVSCTGWLWCRAIFVPCAITPYFIRLRKLRTVYEFQKLVLQENKPNGKSFRAMNSEAVADAFRQRLAHRGLALKFFFSLLIMHLLIATGLQATQNVYADVNNTDVDRSCRENLITFAVEGFVVFCYFVLILVLVYRVRKVRDAFAINREMTMLCTIWVTHLPVYLILARVAQTIWTVVSMTFLSFLISIVWPLILTYTAESSQMEKKLSHAASHGEAGHKKINLDQLLADPEGLKALKDYAVTEFSLENVLFLEAVQEYKSTESVEARRTMALRMHSTFIAEDSVYEINISGTARRGIHRDLIEKADTEPSPQLFEVAETQVADFMTEDVLPRFYRSDIYAKYRTKEHAEATIAMIGQTISRSESKASVASPLRSPRAALTSPDSSLRPLHTSVSGLGELGSSSGVGSPISSPGSIPSHTLLPGDTAS
eukprot:TRINITY_DN3667_c0_g1_i1.p1 TRINITY_DN3667_c0_g1~~TRINITY_DN3667_c0_g1_i1.p1  ORF type:complete len:502 (+),score=97.06 TRINITY_DN3667_c0_g1_i1:209-1507(+)